MKPTPGPWHVGETRHQYDCVIRNFENDPVAITQLAGYSKSTGKANAHFIAAVWDLYDGCNALLGLLQLIRDRDDVSAELAEIIRTSHRVNEAEQAAIKWALA